MATGGDVAAHHVADRLGLLPANIALVGVWHQRQPLAARLALNLHVNGSGVIARRDGRLTISIGAAVDRVLDHSVDGGVVRAPPSRATAPWRRPTARTSMLESQASGPHRYRSDYNEKQSRPTS
jgi:hypothetical protein